MSGVNKVILVGHLGKDPEIRHLDNNVSVASFPLATSETYNKDGRRIEQTEWHNIVMWRGLADIAAKYLHKGKLVYIEGKIRTRTYEDKEGIKRYATEIVAESFNMLGRKTDFEGSSPTNHDNKTNSSTHDSNEVNFKENDRSGEKTEEDDLPF
ncbi:MAG TPA: single-stranded DNA-binding protein [Sphingobacteriaceae bacterium]|nr:single-stranded DNA-binding protein [Sphingobacteriaceae bacterium]